MTTYGDGTYGGNTYGADGGGGSPPSAPHFASTPPQLIVEIAFPSRPFAGELVAQMVLQVIAAGQPNYEYVDLAAVSDYTIQDGDVLEYWVWPLLDATRQRFVGLELEGDDGGGWNLRGSGATDQAGRSTHPSTDLTAVANSWYHRQIPLTPSSPHGPLSVPANLAGRTVSRFMIAIDTVGTAFVQRGLSYFTDVVITNSGRVVKKIWGQVDAPPTAPSLANVYLSPPTGSQVAVSKTLFETIGWTDVTHDVLEIDVARGRNHELDRIDPATASLVLDNRSRRYDPDYQGAGSYYPNVKPMRKIRIRAIYGGVTYYLFTGFVERWPSAQRGRSYDTSITCVDALTVLGDVTINKFYATDYTGNRISAVLDDAGWPTADRSIAVGDSQLQPLSAATGGTEIVALQHIQDGADAELGLFFADAQGRTVFQNRLARIQPPYSVSQATFYDDATEASGRLVYIGITSSYDVDQVYNYISVTPAAASTPQVVEDPIVSQVDYGRRSMIRTPIVLTSADALAQAGFLLSRYQQPSLRFDDLTLEPFRQAALWPQVLGRDISDRISIQETPGQTPIPLPITRNAHIERVEHSIRAARGDSAMKWTTKWAVSPADVQSYWSLAGSAGDAWSANSVLDQTTRVAY